MPVDFDPGGPSAFVDFGDGLVDKIRFTADDASCMWNDFPVSIECCPLDCSTPPSDPQTVYQTTNWTTALAAGQQSPPEATWPLMRVYNYLHAILCGYTLEVRMRFTVLSGRGNYWITNPFTGSAFSGGDTGIAVVNIDTGWVNPHGPNCTDISGSPPPNDVVTFGLSWQNFNPGIADVVGNGILEGRWTAGFTPIAAFEAFQQYDIVWHPPCDPNEGLVIRLPTNSCGVPTKTYTQIRNDVNALALGLTASVLGGHGGDTAEPDPDSTVAPACVGDFYGKPMSGADCTGGTDYREGMETP